MALCSVRERDGILIASIPPSLDHVASQGLEKELRELVARQPDALFCDLSGTKYISSSGLRIFLATTKLAKTTGLRFGFVSPTPFVTHVFSVSGLAGIFPVYETEDAAIAAARKT